jgi:hypothetical protein
MKNSSNKFNMANYTGAVRFEDESLLYFVYQGTTDIALKQLYMTSAEADEARANNSISEDLATTVPEDAETVNVMPYFCHGDTEVMFCSTASRSSLLISGPLSRDAVAWGQRGQDIF